jgi:competence protein ComEC
MAMSRAYGAANGPPRHPWRDRDVVAVAAAMVCGVWQHDRLWCWGLAVAGAAVVCRRRSVVVGAAMLVLAGAALSRHSWEQTTALQEGPYVGYATVVGDAATFGRGVRVVLEIEGRRYEAWVYGSPRRRLSEAQDGQRYYVEGVRRRLGANARRAQVRHVVGRVDLEVVGDRLAGSQAAVLAERVRGSLRRGAEAAMSAEAAALFTGLVIGDDARQSPSMIESFRSAGLSHLTAVSGQNVGFVLLAASPLLRRLRAGWRWAATVLLIVWFMALTRFEPSVIRAGLMAALSASAFALGRQQAALRLLALAVGIAVLADPLLVWSVGFWLSVGATAGVIVAGPWLAKAMAGPVWLRLPFAVTLGAQLGVALPSLLVFGRLPVVSVITNLLAVPVAGAVMLYGLPAGLLAGAVPQLAGPLLLPAEIGVRWVSTVAALGARAQPGLVADLAGWAAVVAACAAMVVRRRRVEAG